MWQTALRYENLMKATFILGTVLLALVLGIGAMASGSTGLVAAVAVGVMPVLLGISALIEQRDGQGYVAFRRSIPISIDARRRADSDAGGEAARTAGR